MRVLMVLRKCRACGKEARNKAELDLFITHKHSKYGKDTLCKECKSKRSKIYRQANSDIIRRKNRDFMKTYYPKHRRERLQYAKEYRNNNRKKIKAKIKTQRTPLASNCEKCNSSSVRLERHHPDYDKPKVFVTLCVPCHRQIHRNLEKKQP